MLPTNYCRCTNNTGIKVCQTSEIWLTKLKAYRRATAMCVSSRWRLAMTRKGHCPAAESWWRRSAQPMRRWQALTTDRVRRTDGLPLTTCRQRNTGCNMSSSRLDAPPACCSLHSHHHHHHHHHYQPLVLLFIIVVVVSVVVILNTVRSTVKRTKN